MELQQMQVTGPGLSLTGPQTTSGNSNDSSIRGSFRLKPTVPTVDIQVCKLVKVSVSCILGEIQIF